MVRLTPIVSPWACSRGDNRASRYATSPVGRFCFYLRLWVSSFPTIILAGPLFFPRFEIAVAPQQVLGRRPVVSA
jgi:hypothetical protein